MSIREIISGLDKLYQWIIMLPPRQVISDIGLIQGHLL